MIRPLSSLLAWAAVLSGLTASVSVPTSGLRGEFALGIGAGFTQARGNTLQRQSWIAGPLSGATIENAFTIDGRPAFFLGGSYTNFFGGRLGLQAGFGYLKSPLRARTVFRREAAGAPAVRLSADPDPGEITAVPFYAALALDGRSRRGGFSLAAGPALILHSVLAETQAGTLAAGPGPAAAFRVPSGIADQTWVAVGAVIAATLDIRFGGNKALTLDVRYFLSPARDFHWVWTAGPAVGLDDPAARTAFDAGAAEQAGAAAPSLTLNPSFLQISLGLKFLRPPS